MEKARQRKRRVSDDRKVESRRSGKRVGGVEIEREARAIWRSPPARGVKTTYSGIMRRERTYQMLHLRLEWGGKTTEKEAESERMREKNSGRKRARGNARGRARATRDDAGASVRVEDTVFRKILEEEGTHLVGVEQLAAAHELVDDEIILGVLRGHVLVEVKGGLEVDSLGLGDGRGAHFARVVVC